MTTVTYNNLNQQEREQFPRILAVHYEAQTGVKYRQPDFIRIKVRGDTVVVDNDDLVYDLPDEATVKSLALSSATAIAAKKLDGICVSDFKQTPPSLTLTLFVLMNKINAVIAAMKDASLVVTPFDTTSLDSAIESLDTPVKALLNDPAVRAKLDM